MNSRKGNAFSAEALLGAMLFMLVIWSLNSFAVQNSSHWTIAEERMADDVLIVLEKNETLATQNITLMESELRNIIGNNSALNFRMELQTWNYTNGAYINISNSVAGSSLPDNIDIAIAERSFFASNSSSGIANMTRVRLYLWR